MKAHGIGRGLAVLFAATIPVLSPVLGTVVQEADPTDSGPAATPPRASRMQGSAYLDRNRDVVGATVVVRPMDDPTVLYLTSTDGSGRFKVDGLPDGEYQVRIERYGVLPISKQDVQVRFPFRAVVELDMEPAQDRAPATRTLESAAAPMSGAVRLEGRIRDQDLAPLAEATVRLVHPDGRVDPVMATSAEDGSFAVEDIPAGRWQLAIQGVGALPIRTEVALVADTELLATLVRQPATYVPSPFELMPPEHPIPPEALGAPRLSG